VHWKLAPFAVAFLLAYFVRGGAIHAALAQKRPIRAVLIWLKTCVVTVPAVVVLAVVIVVISESGLFD
jgi:hypothetical protein